MTTSTYLHTYPYFIPRHHDKYGKVDCVVLPPRQHLFTIFFYLRRRTMPPHAPCLAAFEFIKREAGRGYFCLNHR